MTSPSKWPKWLTREEACAYLREEHSVVRAVKTLAKEACLGGGPKFRKVGPSVQYAPADLDAYAASKASPVVASTSELHALRAA